MVIKENKILIFKIKKLIKEELVLLNIHKNLNFI